jgi:hypothetical protein
MKKVYKRPTAEIVVLNLGEQIAWGEGANASNTGTHTEAKEQSFDEEEEKLPDFVGSIKFRNVWDEDDN